MDQQDQQAYFSDLISRYLSGNTNATEQAELERWVLADPANKKQFVAFKKAWMLSGMNKQRDAGVDAMWNRTAEQLFPAAKTRTMVARPRRNQWLKIAAAVLVLIVSTILGYRHWQSQQPFFAEATTVSMPYDLADGSRVTLNRASSLQFVATNEDGEREVTLTGDAFFDVARNEEAPFVIATQNVEIEVLGTSFYVDSRVDQAQVQVIVQSGQVAVRAGDQEVILNQGEQAVFAKADNQLLKKVNEDANYLALKSGELVFKDTPLPQAVFALNRQFNAKLVITEDALNTCTITSIFKNKSLDAILIIMEASFGIQSAARGDQIVLAGTCERNE